MILFASHAATRLAPAHEGCGNLLPGKGLGQRPNRLGIYPRFFRGLLMWRSGGELIVKEQLDVNPKKHNGFHHSTPVDATMMQFLRCD